MALNPQKGNMYKHITHTWNAIKGRCGYDCKYCYMKIFKLKPLRLDKSEFTVNLGTDNFIFVGSSTDMFHINVPTVWIARTLYYCNEYPNNRYLFQSKNPHRFFGFVGWYPLDSHFATTIESNRNYPSMSQAPPVEERAKWIRIFGQHFPVSITIEPILDFDRDILVEWLKKISPEWVVIGADSKGHQLPEPPMEKVAALIEKLSRFTEVILKDNLSRIGVNKL